MSIPGGYIGYLRDRLRRRTAPKAAPDMSALGPGHPAGEPGAPPAAGAFPQVTARCGSAFTYSPATRISENPRTML